MAEEMHSVSRAKPTNALDRTISHPPRVLQEGKDQHSATVYRKMLTANEKKKKKKVWGTVICSWPQNSNVLDHLCICLINRTLKSHATVTHKSVTVASGSHGLTRIVRSRCAWSCRRGRPSRVTCAPRRPPGSILPAPTAASAPTCADRTLARRPPLPT